MILGYSFTLLIIRALLLYYSYRSWKALSGGNVAEAHWLTFWMLYAFVQVVEVLSDVFLYRVPFYNEIKLAFYVYLGQFNGATVVYEKFGKNAIKSVEGQVKQLSEKPEVKQLVQATQEKLQPLYNLRAKPAAN
eukprot:EG_transcript_33025